MLNKDVEVSLWSNMLLNNTDVRGLAVLNFAIDIAVPGYAVTPLWKRITCKILHLKTRLRSGMVAHTYNPSTLGGQGRQIT